MLKPCWYSLGIGQQTTHPDRAKLSSPEGIAHRQQEGPEIWQWLFGIALFFFAQIWEKYREYIRKQMGDIWRQYMKTWGQC